MRRFLICSGVHGRPKSLDFLRQAVEMRQPEAVLFAGGVLGGTRPHAARSGPAWGVSNGEAKFIEHFFAAMGGLGVFGAIIPGPADTPLERFLRMGMRAEVEFPGVHVVHAGTVFQGDVMICGLGGPLCEGAAGAEGGCSRTLAEYYLRPLWTARQPHRILLLSSPPPGLIGGPQGKLVVGDLIDSLHPSLCAVGGVNERRGARRIASTLVVNPGHLAEGWAAWLDWGRPADEQLEFINLRVLQQPALTADRGVCD